MQQCMYVCEVSLISNLFNSSSGWKTVYNCAWKEQAQLCEGLVMAGQACEKLSNFFFYYFSHLIFSEVCVNFIFYVFWGDVTGAMRQNSESYQHEKKKSYSQPFPHSSSLCCSLPSASFFLYFLRISFTYLFMQFVYASSYASFFLSDLHLYFCLGFFSVALTARMPPV